MDQSELSSVVMAGAGTMGASLAQIFARRGLTVTLWNRSREGLDRAQELIRGNQAALVGSGHLTQEASGELMRRILVTTDESCFSSARFILESIAENLAMKQNLFRRISAMAPGDCIIASNTSGLSITVLAEAVAKPERFVGMHWVNPPHLIPLVEVVQGEKTAATTVDFAYRFALRLGKKPIRAKDVPGFVLNRLQFAVFREALFLVEQGVASIEDIDGAMKYGLGPRYACLGPFETADFGGVDVFYNIASYLFADLAHTDTIPQMLQSRYENGDWGLKSGRGFYDYAGDKAGTAMEDRDRKLIGITDALFAPEE